jgi:hypothetical protein
MYHKLGPKCHKFDCLAGVLLAVASIFALVLVLCDDQELKYLFSLLNLFTDSLDMMFVTQEKYAAQSKQSGKIPLASSDCTFDLLEVKNSP